MESIWYIELLGELKAWKGEHVLSHWRTRKTVSLLAYLVYYADRCHPREALAERFWPDSEPSAARQNLRTELSFLRRQLEVTPEARGAVLIADNTSVRFAPRSVLTDVSQLEQAYQAAVRAQGESEKLAHFRQVVRLYREGLLPGCYDAWLLPEQERLADLHLDALRQTVALLHRRDEGEAAIAYARRAVAASPLCEPAHADLIRLYIEMGRKADALRHYRQMEQRLRETLDVAPEQETRCLLDSIFPPTRTTAPLSPRPGDAPEHERRSPVSLFPAERTPLLPWTGARFIGREREMAQIRALLSGRDVSAETPCLITLTGPGGCGKTRLAVEAARALRAADGLSIPFVSLADLTPEGSLLHRIAETLRLPPGPESDLLEQIEVALSALPSLLILDNFEHLAPSAKEVLFTLLSRSVNAHFLITSRHRIGLAGEQEIPLRPLQVPASEEASPEAILASESVQMFLERAQSARPDFYITSSNARECAAICRRLDGLPLGIDLVAGWASLLTPSQMLARMEEEPGLPSRHSQGIASRHVSLNAAMDWSWQLLDAPLRAFFVRLSLFRGSWSLEAAQFLCQSSRTLELIAALRDRSLITAEENAGAMRFRLLEPIREYAQKRLVAEERERLRKRHAAYFLVLAQQAEQEHWENRDTLRADQGNFLAALDYLEGGEAGVRLAAMLSTFWQREGKLEEAERQITRTLETAIEVAPVWRARALLAGAVIARIRGDYARARVLRDEGADLCADLNTEEEIITAVLPLADPVLIMLSMGTSEDQGRMDALLRRGGTDPRIQAYRLGWQGRCAYFQGDYAKAEAHLEASQTLYRELGDRQGLAVALFLCGEVAVYRGNLGAANRLWEQCLEIYRGLDYTVGIAKITLDLGYLARRQHESRRARALAEEAMTLSRRFGLRSHLATALWLLGTIALSCGEYDRATPLLEESLNIGRSLGDVWAIADPLSALAMTANELGDYSRARLLCLEALELRRKEQDKLDIAISLGDLGLIALCQEDYTGAESLLEEGLELLRTMQEDNLKARMLGRLGLTACRRGEMVLANQRLRESLTLLVPGANLLAIAEVLEYSAEWRLCQRQFEEAAVLYAQAAILREKVGTPVPPRERLRRAVQELALQQSLGQGSLEHCVQTGQAMTWEQAIAYALIPA